MRDTSYEMRKDLRAGAGYESRDAKRFKEQTLDALKAEKK